MGVGNFVLLFVWETGVAIMSDGADHYRDSLYARSKWLRKAVGSPKSVDSSIYDACKSHETLAKWRDGGKGIYPMARNTMYKYADDCFSDELIPEGPNEGECGYRYLDWLRKKARDSLEEFSKKRSTASRKARKVEKENTGKIAKDKVREHSLCVGKAYLDLLTQVIAIANEVTGHEVNVRLRNLVHDHDRLFGDLFREVGSVRPDNVEWI